MTAVEDDWNEWELLEGICCDTDEDAEDLHRAAARLGVNAWELSILEAIWYQYGQVPSKELLIQRAFGTFAARDPMKAKAAVDRCFEKSLIRFLTAEFLKKVKDELRSGNYLIPNGLIGRQPEIEGFSVERVISFTRTGASLFQKWIGLDPLDPKREHWVCGLDSEGAPAIYGTSIYACKMTSCWKEPAVAVGRWCDRWWNCFESGFRMQWQTTEYDAIQWFLNNKKAGLT